MIGRLLSGERFELGCTVEIENSFDSLHAHVELDGDVAIHPGDEVLVHGAPVAVPYGERVTLRRRATVRRAGRLERLWLRSTSDLEVLELFEFSFSERATS